MIKFAEKRAASESRSLSGGTTFTSTMPAGDNSLALSSFKPGGTAAAAAALNIQSGTHQTFRSASQICSPVRCNHSPLTSVLCILCILIVETY